MKIKYFAFALLAYLLIRSRNQGLGRLVSGRNVPLIRSRKAARRWAKGARQTRKKNKKYYRDRKNKLRSTTGGTPIYGGKPWGINKAATSAKMSPTYL